MSGGCRVKLQSVKQSAHLSGMRSALTPLTFTSGFKPTSAWESPQCSNVMWVAYLSCFTNVWCTYCKH